MEIVKIGPYKLGVQDDITRLTWKRFALFNRFAAIDAGIGSDLQDFDRRLARIKTMARAKNFEGVENEIQAARQNLAFVVSGVSPKMLSFAALIETINGKPVEVGEDEAQDLLDALAPWVGMMETDLLLERVKKKLILKFQHFFQLRGRAIRACLRKNLTPEPGRY